MVLPVSNAMKHRYLVLRSLFDKPMHFDELVDETDLTTTLLLNALKSLFNSHAIKSKTLYPQNKDFDTELKKIGLEKGWNFIEPPKAKKIKFYQITNKGRNQIAYYEYKHQFYKEFQTKYDDSLNQPYYEEIQEIIQENNHFNY